MVLCFFCIPAIAQPTQGTSSSGQTLEYIESSSPVPGGGVVSSVYVPGQRGPVYRGGPANGTGAGQGNGQGQSVLDPSLSSGNSTPRQAYLPPLVNSQIDNRQRVYQIPNPQAPAATYQVPTTNYQVPAASQIPSLGVPTNWDRSIRANNNCAGCGPGAGVVPYGFGQATTPVVGGQVARFPQSQPVFSPPQRSTYTPLIPLQRFPPNAYAGQGIIGSPKLYVDGQPVRNLLRYLWIP